MYRREKKNLKMKITENSQRFNSKRRTPTTIRIAQKGDTDDWKIEEDFLAIVVESGSSKGAALDTQKGVLVVNDL